mgnify:FL=1
MLAALASLFTGLSNASTVLSDDQKSHVAQVLETDAELMSATALEDRLTGESPEVAAEIIRINDEAGPIALQIALGVPILAALAGGLNAFRMRRLSDPDPSVDRETVGG